MKTYVSDDGLVYVKTTGNRITIKVGDDIKKVVKFITDHIRRKDPKTNAWLKIRVFVSRENKVYIVVGKGRLYLKPVGISHQALIKFVKEHFNTRKNVRANADKKIRAPAKKVNVPKVVVKRTKDDKPKVKKEKVD